MKHKCDGCRYKGGHREMMFKPFGVCLRETDIINAERTYKADKCPYERLKDLYKEKCKDAELVSLARALEGIWGN